MVETLLLMMTTGINQGDNFCDLVLGLVFRVVVLRSTSLHTRSALVFFFSSVLALSPSLA